MKRRIRVLVVDDNELVRGGLRRMLESEKDMSVVGDCTDANVALSQVGTLSPDVILMDIDMPGMNGIEATRHLKRNGLNCKADVIVLAECTDYLIGALEAGAAGYLLKDTSSEGLVETIRQVHQKDQSPDENDDLVEQVELVIAQPTDALQLSSFAAQVEKTLQASIVETVGSWDGGTAITVLVERTSLENVLGRLWNIPGLERIEELPLARGFSSLVKKFRTLSGSRDISKRRLLIDLKEAAGIPSRELAVALN